MLDVLERLRVPREEVNTAIIPIFHHVGDDTKIVHDDDSFWSGYLRMAKNEPLSGPCNPNAGRR